MEVTGEGRRHPPEREEQGDPETNTHSCDLPWSDADYPRPKTEELLYESNVIGGRKRLFG
jgi:hypothetical protein